MDNVSVILEVHNLLEENIAIVTIILVKGKRIPFLNKLTYSFLTNRTDNKLCSGEDRGVCECGTCKCFPGWRGDACQCPDHDLFCMDPRGGDGQVCSGRGKCECGRCKCDPGGFSGKYCEECPTCPGHRCAELQPCVECFLKDFVNCSTNLNCSNSDFSFIRDMKEDVNGEKKVCTFFDESRCTVMYQYYGQGDMLNVEVQKDKVCPEGPDVLGKNLK